MVFPYVFCRMKGLLTLAIALVFPLMACAAPIPVALPAADLAQAPQPASAAHADHGHEGAELRQLAPTALAEDEKLRVVATTNILADVVRSVGGDQIELTSLLPVGADPHSYNATPADLRLLSDAHVVFIVGEGIEESLLAVLENREGGSALITVNTGIDLMEMHDEAEAHPDDHEDEHAEEHEETHAEAEAHHHHDLDPHTWTAVPNVIHWVEIIEHALGELDPANAEVYESAATAYLAELEALDNEIAAAVAAIPVENRKLVTDHETFGYFAARYGFEVIGSVIPSFSTLAAPSAQELAALQRQIEAEGVKAIFVGSTVNPSLAGQIADDVGVQVVPLYADSLSDPTGPAPTYIDMMRYNVTAIVAALQ
ncbi:MAG: zinc ABC transporter substrate-binding protein [Caldilineaceae bacterium]|nr:zinc ABC transporter substrate-binding protein [Caldilineaceae bacterium]